MCTAVSFGSSPHCFGRNLDLDYCYEESITVMPRAFPLKMRCLPQPEKNYALIGMAYVSGGYPLYYDATNEKGLSAAGLRFPGAVYPPAAHNGDNIAPFELIPWVLRQCSDVGQVRHLLRNARIANIMFSPELPSAPLHWLISDRESSIAVEPTARGLEIYDNPVGVLTNAPGFEHHMLNLAGCMQLSEHPPENRLAPDIGLERYSLGMGGIGLPGDLSSPSRFVRAAFTALKSVCEDGDAVSQTFHILGSVEQQRGCVRVGDGYEITRYTSCCDTDNGVYYCRTYRRSRIVAVDMHREELDGSQLAVYPLPDGEEVRLLN